MDVMKEISILLTKYTDWISSLVWHFCGGYTHASISLGDEPGIYYSFNYRGFAVETIEKHKRRGVRYSRCYRIQISDKAYQMIQKKIWGFMKDRNTYKYTRFGVFCCVCHIPFRWKKHYFCSQFVAELLDQSGAVELDRTSSLFLPNHFIEVMERQKGYQLIENVV